MLNNARKYLVVGPAWVGDMVMAQSLFIDLKHQHPDCTIDVIAPEWTSALIDVMPEVSKLVPAKFEHGKLGLSERWKTGRALREEAYSHAIVLPNSLKSAFVPAFAGANTRTGFIGEQRWGLLNDIRRLDRSALAMTVQRFLALGREKGAPVILPEKIPAPNLKVDEDSAASTLSVFSLQLNKPVLALCPGAEFGASKKWPTAYYAQVAEHFLSEGWQIWLLGSSKDKETCEDINQRLNNGAKILAGHTSLNQAVTLISQSTLVISNDSGLMHIAAGLNRPLVAIYGSTDPGHTPPLSKNHRIARVDIDCAPCFKRECPLHHHDCMNLVDAGKVIDLSSQVLK